MKKSTQVFIGLILFDILAIIIVTGKIIEFAGIGSILFWLIQPILTLYFIVTIFINQKNIIIISVLLMIMYLLVSGLHIFQKSMKTPISETVSENRCIIIYEINPGAMSHTSYEIRHSIALIDTKYLKITFIEKSEKRRSIG